MIKFYHIIFYYEYINIIRNITQRFKLSIVWLLSYR